ncbi:MAG: hypothetical protein H8F28_24840 [Fibrella sp.]|nr:hypothetical protein [Armatimonadota bacterium]
MLKTVFSLFGIHCVRQLLSVTAVFVLGPAVLSLLQARNARAQAYSFYGATAGDSAVTLYQYNFNSNNTFHSRELVLNTGLNFVNGLAWDRNTENVYYRNGTNALSSGSGSQDFYAYNRDTGLQTLIRHGGGVNLVASGIRFANASYYDNAYWAIASATDDLYRVTFDVTTDPDAPTYNAQLWAGDVNYGNNGGSPDRGVSNDEVLDFGDIAVDTSNGVLYGFAINAGAFEFFSGDLDLIQGTIGGAGTTLGGNTINAARRAATDTSLVQLALSLRDNNTVGDTLFGAADTGLWYTLSLTNGSRGSTPIANIPDTVLADLTSGAAYQPVPATPSAVSLGIGALVGLMGMGSGKIRSRRGRRETPRGA